MLAVGRRFANSVVTQFSSVKSRNFVVKNRPLQFKRKYCFDSGGKTAVTILNSEPDAPLMVDSYNQFGFRLNNGIAIVGPMIIFPKTILSWNVGGPEDISEESLSLFFVLEPKLDILLIGIGERGNKIDPRVVTSLKRHGTNVEILTTDAACATFNFLNAEQRSVAGALLPPQSIIVTDNDVIDAQIRQKKLFKLEDS